MEMAHKARNTSWHPFNREIQSFLDIMHILAMIGQSCFEQVRRKFLCDLPVYDLDASGVDAEHDSVVVHSLLDAERYYTAVAYLLGACD
eukprot:2900120-Pyramimonas_sp.AAC.1